MAVEAITKPQLNGAIKALPRPVALAILDKFGVLTTADLKSEQWQAAYDACQEARSKIASTTP